jgi:GntR family transcriptional regulator of arabinose operon
VNETGQDLPKYRQIIDSLKDAILAGRYESGERLPSEAELVKTFDTSRITVSRALRELQLGGMIERRVGSGSYVTPRRSPGYAFGLLIPDLGTTEIFEPICRGMAEAHLPEQHVLLWGKLPSDPVALETQARASCRQWAAKKVSGVFFAPLELAGEKDTVNRRIVEMFATAGLPLVLIDRDFVTYPERSAYDLVGIDNRRAGYALTEHMITSGCRRLVFVGKHRSAPSCLARAVGFRDAVQDGGLPFTESMVIHQADPTDLTQVRELIETHRPEGIVCSNDFTAAQLMRTLETIGLTVPDDVRLGGFDDVKYASLLPVPLTTIHQPCAEIGEVAMSAMADRLLHPDLPARDILLDFTLVVRESTGGSSQQISSAVAPAADDTVAATSY